MKFIIIVPTFPFITLFTVGFLLMSEKIITRKKLIGIFFACIYYALGFRQVVTIGETWTC